MGSEWEDGGFHHRAWMGKSWRPASGLCPNWGQQGMMFPQWRSHQFFSMLLSWKTLVRGNQIYKEDIQSQASLICGYPRKIVLIYLLWKMVKHQVIYNTMKYETYLSKVVWLAWHGICCCNYHLTHLLDKHSSKLVTSSNKNISDSQPIIRNCWVKWAGLHSGSGEDR